VYAFFFAFYVCFCFEVEEQFIYCVCVFSAILLWFVRKYFYKIILRKIIQENMLELPGILKKTLYWTEEGNNSLEKLTTYFVSNSFKLS